MIIIGIDPGVSGGISVLENKKVIDVFEMPTMIDGKKNKKQVNGAQVSNIIKEKYRLLIKINRSELLIDLFF